jgi:phenylpropionate dioxygenase-like ring-hydroxylating dioxygenase large terminal subunit
MSNIEEAIREDSEFSVPGIPFAAQDGGGSDAMAPLIFNAWYVIALDEQVDRTLKSIKVLGQPLVYYRAEDGRPVVLDDRCLHRRFPLSKGQLKGDSVQCGYHGFTYDRTGQCIWAPGVPLTAQGEAKLPFGVRAYPCAQQGPWLWVWMGKPELADPATIPLPHVEPGHSLTGYKMNPANYMMLIENLLDLSHLHFLHDAADLEHAGTVPRDAPSDSNGIGWIKTVERTEQGVIAVNHGGDPKQLVRQEQTSIQYGPSLLFWTSLLTAFPGDPPAKPGLLSIAHALTPLDERNTHQFFWLITSDPYVIPTEAVQNIIENVVFQQDVEAVSDIQANVNEDRRPGRIEVSMTGDRWGIKMRKMLKELKAREVAAG